MCGRGQYVCTDMHRHTAKAVSVSPPKTPFRRVGSTILSIYAKFIMVPVCDRRTGYAVAGIFSVLVTLVFLCTALLSSPGSLFYLINPENIGVHGNVVIYLAAGGVFISSFVSISLVVKKDMFPDLNISLRLKYCLIAGFSIASAVTVYLLYAALYQGYYRVHTFSPPVLAIILVLVSMAAFAALYHEKGKFNKKWILYTIYACVAVVLGLTVTTPNIFYEGGGLAFGTHSIDSMFNVHHASSYIDSIYSTLKGQPYTGDYTDQYGHYGLFFYVPLKLFGGSMLTISIIMGVLMALSALFLMGAVHISLRSNYLKAFVAIAGGLCLAANTAAYIYWQVLPHRMIFPCAMIFLVALYSKKDALTKKEYAVGSLISILAVLWNFESGIAVAAAWFMFIIIRYYQDNDFNVRSFAKTLSVMAGALALYIFIPYLIVNAYNYLVTGLDPGSFLSMREFIGSTLDPYYMSYLNYRWTLGAMQIEFLMLLFLGCIAWALVSTSILSPNGKRSTPAIVAASISIAGLVLLTKSVNNTLNVPVGIWLFAAAALGILASQMIWELKNIKQWKKFDLCSLVKIPVCSLALIGLVMMGTHAADIGKTVSPLLSPDYGGFVSFTKEVEEYVPRDTLAVGEGTTAIYMELGWDKRYYKFYSTDDELRELFSTNDSFFILTEETELSKDHSKFVDLGEYHLVREFSYRGIHYGYYEKNP